MEEVEASQHHQLRHPSERGDFDPRDNSWHYQNTVIPQESVRVYSEQPISPKSIDDIPDLLLQEGITGVGLLVMGIAVWFLFKRLEGIQQEARSDLVNLIKEGNSTTLAFINKIGEFELTVSTSIADLKARMENLEREVEMIREKQK
tara:strand:- start:701 stop:1141 length:441 start_codon:yes stop_codon:yes gene_type:complete